MAPNAFQVYNDYASPERIALLGSRRRPLRHARHRRAAAQRRRLRRRPRLRRARRRCRRPRSCVLREPGLPAPTAGRRRPRPSARHLRLPLRAGDARGGIPQRQGRGRRLRRRVEQPRPEPRAQLCQRLCDRRARALPPRPVLVLRPRHRSGDPGLDPRGDRRRTRDAGQSGAGRSRLDHPAAPMVPGDRPEHGDPELRLPASVAMVGQAGAAAPAGAPHAAGRAAGRRRRAAGRRRDLGARRWQSVRGRVPPVRHLRCDEPARRRRARPRTPGPRSRPASPSAISGLPCPARDARS